MSTTVAPVPSLAEPISPVSAPEVEARLVQCFDALRSGDPQSEARLRRAADDYARNVRREALPPEKLVTGLKKALCCHGDSATVPSLRDEQLDESDGSGPTKYARVLRWCIESYYE